MMRLSCDFLRHDRVVFVDDSERAADSFHHQSGQRRGVCGPATATISDSSIRIGAVTKFSSCKRRRHRLDPESPYSLVVSNLAADNYTLTPCHGHGGLSAISSVVTVSVVTPTPITLSSATWPTAIELVYQPIPASVTWAGSSNLLSWRRFRRTRRPANNVVYGETFESKGCDSTAWSDCQIHESRAAERTTSRRGATPFENAPCENAPLLGQVMEALFAADGKSGQFGIRNRVFGRTSDCSTFTPKRLCTTRRVRRARVHKPSRQRPSRRSEPSPVSSRVA